MTSLIAVAAILSSQSNPSISSVTLSGLNDISFTMTVSNANQAELRKINADFAQSYRFRTTLVQLKEPFKLRMTGTVEDMDVLFILNGHNKLVRIPRAGLNQRFNHANEPGKRQTAFDFGLLTPQLFNGYLVASYVRTERSTGEYVFDVRYDPRFGDRTRFRIWVHPQTKFMSKREWYSQMGGHLVATFLYENPTTVSGVRLPTRVVVRNADNRQAGVSTYSNIRLNTGLSDSLFATN